MPSLRDLLEEMADMGIESDELRLPGTLYGRIIGRAEAMTDEPDED